VKFATYQSQAGPRIALVFPDRNELLDLQTAHRHIHGDDNAFFADLTALIQGGDEALFAARAIAETDGGQVARLALDSVKLLAPIPEPLQMRDALCFELHCIQAFKKAREVRASQFPDPAAAMKQMEESNTLSVPKEFYEIPLYYKCNRFSVTGQGTDIVWPHYSKTMDYELEFAAIIGKSGTNVSREDATSYIFGYTILNDLSARDAQVKEQAGNLGPSKGKDFKDAYPMGPWIVTADEVGDPYALEMIVRVNGEERGRGNSRDMFWKFEDVIARITDCEEIRAGEVIASGTVGNGSGLESMRFMDDGDIVELEIEKIGVLRNRIFASRAHG